MSAPVAICRPARGHVLSRHHDAVVRCAGCDGGAAMVVLWSRWLGPTLIGSNGLHQGSVRSPVGEWCIVEIRLPASIERNPPSRPASPSSPKPCPVPRSASFGCWVRVGARDESVELAGASHFLEHLLFKGTEPRSGREISEAIEALGGELNADTAHEHTAFYTRVPAALRRRGPRAAVRRGHVAAVRRRRRGVRAPGHPRGAAPGRGRGRRPGHVAGPRGPLGRPSPGPRGARHARDHRRHGPRPHRRRSSTTTTTRPTWSWWPQGPSTTRPWWLRVSVPARPAGDARSGSRRRPRSRSRTAPCCGARPSRPTSAVVWPGAGRRRPRPLRPRRVQPDPRGGLSSRLFQEIREDRGLAYSVYSSVGRFSTPARCRLRRHRRRADGRGPQAPARDHRRARGRRHHRARAGGGPRLPGGLVPARPGGLRQRHGPPGQPRLRPRQGHPRRGAARQLRAVTPET